MMALAILCVPMSFTSCSSDDDITTNDGYVEGAFNYHISVANDNSDVQLALDSLHSVIVDVRNAPTWLTVIPQDTLNSDSVPVITFRVQEADDGAARKCRIYLTTESKEQVVLNVSQDEAVGDGDNAIEIDPEFLDHWEKMDYLLINDDGKMDTEVDAPWNEDASSTLMSEDICMDVKKKDGWEVAFSLLNQHGHADKNYFGLYNKYTGVLRIFYYCNKNVTGSGSDFAFEVMLGGDKSVPAFYNTLRYGIPADSKVNMNVDVLNSGLAKTFYLLTTPYSDMGQRTLTQGWHAFDIDMSAYTGKSFKTDGGDMKIACKTSTTANVSLGTDITGKIYGDISASIDRKSMVASADGVGSILSNISGILGNTSASSLASIEETICKGALSSLNTYSLWASTACNIAAHVYDFATGTENIPKDSLHGKLDLKTNATADTKGYMTAQTANDVKAFTLKKSAFNGASNFGKGVWQITTSPTIYVINDVVLYTPTTTGRVSVYTYGCHENEYVMNGFKDLRLPYFYDPTSFDVIINPELFPDAKNVKVMSYCGVYANSTEVNNDAFRQAIGMSKPLNQPLEDFKWATSYRYGYQGTSGRLFLKCSPEDFAKTETHLQLTNKYAKIGDEKKVHYYGQLLKLDKSTPADFMIEPQIFYPHNVYGNDDRTYSDILNLPELYVIVILQFESGGKTYSYSRTYLPQFVKISKTEAKTKAAAIETAANGATNKLKLHEYTQCIKAKVEIFNRAFTW